jgi:hypothetical protein
VKAYSVSKAKGQIVPSTRQSITSKEGLVASSDRVLVFIDSPNDTDKTNLNKLGMSLIATSKDDLYLLVEAAPDFAW